MELQNIKTQSLCLVFFFLFQSVNLSEQAKSRNRLRREQIILSKPGMILCEGMTTKNSLCIWIPQTSGLQRIARTAASFPVGAGSWPRT